MPNKILPINGASDDRAQIAQHNANYAKLDAATVTNSFSGPTNKDAVLVGQLPDTLGSGVLMNDLEGLPNIYMATDPSGKPILKVSKAGFDATTTADENLILNSERNTFKIIQKGTTSIPYTPPAASAQIFQSVIPHGLSYVPLLLAWQTDAFGALQTLPRDILAYESSLQSLSVAGHVRALSDTTNLTFQTVITPKISAPGVIDIRYFIIAEAI